MTQKQLIKTCYVPPRGKNKDVLLVTSRDLATGEKTTDAIESPHLNFYTSKQEFWSDDSEVMMSRPMDELEIRTAPYRDITRHVAAMTGRMAEMDLAGGNPRHIHYTNNVCGSDFDIEDIATDDFLIDHDWTQIQPLTLKLAFYDIEVDIIDIIGFANENEAKCPVNLITYYQSWANTMYVYINEENNAEMSVLVGDAARMQKLKTHLEQRLSQQRGEPVIVHLIPCGD